MGDFFFSTPKNSQQTTTLFRTKNAYPAKFLQIVGMRKEGCRRVQKTFRIDTLALLKEEKLQFLLRITYSVT